MLDIKIVNNIINSSYCDLLITFFKEFKNHHVIHRDTFVLEVYPSNVSSFPEPVSDLIKFINSKITFYIKNVSSRAFINYSQIVCWPESSYQDPHNDFDYHTHTSILYLNDDYGGGETFVESCIVKPKKGSIVFFEGSKHIHGVNKVMSGTRYTFPTWFKSME